MRSRLLVAASVVVAGALLVLLAASQQWGSLGRTTVTGRQVSAALPALALALLSLAVSVAATRGLLRRFVAAVGVAVATVDVVVAIRARDDIAKSVADRAFAGVSGSVVSSVPHTNGWWVVAVAGGVVAALAFSAVAIAGARWQGMGARYDAPRAAARAKDPSVAAWEALDRGDDPTA